MTVSVEDLGHVSEVFEGLRYDTRMATLLAEGKFIGPMRLYRTARGRYFVVSKFFLDEAWEPSKLTPVSIEAAQSHWTRLLHQKMTFEEAFPTIEVRDA